jgi:hypothetical protein
MDFDDLTVSVAAERIAEMRREADAYRLAHQSRRSRRSRRSRAQRRWTLRRESVSAKMASGARIANEILGAIISPTWPTNSEPHRYVRPSAGR